ncbi:MAG: biotin/lipoyl-containing protein, partial [Limisphaerales bacterium]
MSEIKQILVPDVGGNEVEIIEILVEVGDSVELEQGVVSVETEKATMDIPAPFAGVITEITAAVGGKIKQGDSIGSIQVVATESDAEPAKPEAPPGAKVEEPAVEEPKQDAAAISPAPTEKKPPLPPVEIPENGSIYASPSVRRVAREFGVNLTLVTGSGRKGRILKSDVKSY